jgi:hypothetical protein
MARLRNFGDKAMVGFGGDVSDMQYLDRLLDSMDIKEAIFIQIISCQMAMLRKPNGIMEWHTQVVGSYILRREASA